MVAYLGANDYKHGEERLGILLVNLGTPNAPKAADLRVYLREFLNDTRVIENSSLKWKFILNCIIIPTRAPRSAAAYRKIWRKEGSPLMIYSYSLLDKLSKRLMKELKIPLTVELGMSYGQPSIKTAMNSLQKKNISKLLLLPLYPQYSGSTVASVFDSVFSRLSNWRLVPDICAINSYHDDSGFINALVNSILLYQRKHGKPQILLFSFHGMPLKSLLQGDPYHCQCYKTARLVAEKLSINFNEYKVCFQSRFGKSVWLQPYTDITLAELASKGIRNVQLVCPGFAADCVETLEEIDIENREIFINHGGERFGYIPCLNDTDEHVNALVGIIKKHISYWLSKLSAENESKTLKQKIKLMQDVQEKMSDYYME